MTTTRRLAAIMAADIAGFSAAMERDEEGTFAQVQELRRKVIEPKIAEHQGRLIKTTGDGFLAEFASPIAATKCALAIQAELATARLQLRIGLNLGDVIVEESGDVYGEGVNVAARLEALADPGGILISAKVHSEIEGKLEAAFEDRGEQQVKNIVRPVRTYAAKMSITRSVSTPVSAALRDGGPLPLPDKPSIAVLPFQNMSGDPEQEYFADGMVEEITTGLSLFQELFVIARNSSFAYKGKTIDVKQVGRELGVRYVLEGSVRKSAGRVRITGQLIDAKTGIHLWADRFEGALDDVFELQDRVSERVLGAIALRLEKAEINRATRKPTENLDAYDYFLRGTACVYRWSKKDTDDALRLFYRAIQLDPDFAAPYAFATWCYTWRKMNMWMNDTEKETAETVRLARRAIALGNDDAFVLCWAGFSINYVARELDEGAALLDRAVELNPNLARAWNLSGLVRIGLGEYDTAIEYLTRAMRFSPLDPAFQMMQWSMATAHFFAGRYEEASAWAERALERQPDLIGALGALAASCAMAGQLDKARKAMARMLEIDPRRHLSGLRDRMGPLRRREDVERFVEACRLAGMPE